ncbi:hypothetical protein ACEWY4_024527 [Coilia grayii]|uniref:ribonuclease H n=1 Tax=Coilia grayii TaxID=363190 RepID=A0ABD1J0L9_9TELE
MTQGLCNSSASFMRMMLSIFGDLYISSLLCYLDDLLVFAPSEQEARTGKKCHLLQGSVKFLGHIIDGAGVAVDPDKVDVIVKMSKTDLMEDDGCTPSVRRVKSFLGMVFYYQHFIPHCSAIAKPLFALTAGQKRKGKTSKVGQNPGVFRKLRPADWTEDCDAAFLSLKEKLLNCAVLTHPDFSKPLILSIDASLDGLGAVLSQDAPSGCLDSSEVKSACDSHTDWESGAELRAMQYFKALPQTVTSEQDTSAILSTDELRRSQEKDSVIRSVLPFVLGGRQPPRRERNKLAPAAQMLCKQWHQLKVQDGVLYRVTKDPSTRQKRFQFVLPFSLRAKALSGVHDLAGHQGLCTLLDSVLSGHGWKETSRTM